MIEDLSTLTDREVRVQAIIQHGLSSIVKVEVDRVISNFNDLCSLRHTQLEKDRKDRGDEIELIRKDVKSIFDKFDRMQLFMIGILCSSVGALLLTIIQMLRGK
jgi:hypothetical protein